MKWYAEQVIWLCIIFLMKWGALYITPLLINQFSDNPKICAAVIFLTALLYSAIINLLFKPIRKAIKVIDAATVFLNKA